MATFNCPTCQKPVEWSAAAKWRPFCSERCRLIDLGAWMTEQRAIPGADATEDDDGLKGGGPTAGQADDDDEDMPRRH
jgi:endogenous inhibitor of DNA gyrase (YacG/DUF329 family)